MNNFRGYLKEADERASASLYNFKEIGNAQNYLRAKNELEKIAKDKNHAQEYQSEHKGDINSVKDDGIKFAIAVVSHKANVKEDQAKPAENIQGSLKNKNTPKEAEDLLNKIGFKPLDNKEAQSLYSSLIPAIKSKQEEKQPPQAVKSVEKIPVSKEVSEKDATDDNSQQKTPETEKKETPSEEETSEDAGEEEETPPDEEASAERYVGKDPGEIASKIEAMAKDEHDKLEARAKEDPRSQRIYAKARAELDSKLREYAKRAEKQMSGFTVHPTPNSKQKALTNAQIAYNYAQSEVRMINNKYLRKELGSTASNMAKSVAGALKNAKEKVKDKIDNSRTIQKTSDLVRQGVQKATDATKAGYAKGKEAVERGVQKVIDRHDANVAQKKTENKPILNKAVEAKVKEATASQASPASNEVATTQNVVKSNVEPATPAPAPAPAPTVPQPIQTPAPPALPASAPQPVAPAPEVLPAEEKPTPKKRIVHASNKNLESRVQAILDNQKKEPTNKEEPAPKKRVVRVKKQEEAGRAPDDTPKKAPKVFTIKKNEPPKEEQEEKKSPAKRQLHFTDKTFNQKRHKRTAEEVTEKKREGARKAASLRMKPKENKNQGMLNFNASVDTSIRNVSKNIRNRIRNI